jgi:pimeloyl-ACP methyl ester carboxylesterase
LGNKQIANLSNVKYIFCDKDKLARYNAENEIICKLELGSDIFILNETGHFPFYEDPEQLEEVLNKILA